METGSKDTFFLKKQGINLGGRLMSLCKPRVMGILNITPDSFFDGGKYFERGKTISRIKEIIEQGADIIDLGACSTRPGATIPTEKEELNRLMPAAEEIRNLYPYIPLSIDTFRSEVAAKMIIGYSATIINDITAWEYDPYILDVITEMKAAYVLMHMQGTPSDMQINPVYSDVVKEIIQFFADKISILRERGISDYIIDPGFGFGKTVSHNYEILRNLEYFSILEAPIMAGISRKSMIYKILESTPEESLNGTTALHMVALLKGADILRVHDVKEAVETIKLFSALGEQNINQKTDLKKDK